MKWRRNIDHPCRWRHITQFLLPINARKERNYMINGWCSRSLFIHILYIPRNRMTPMEALFLFKNHMCLSCSVLGGIYMIYLTGICIFIQLCWMGGMKSPTGWDSLASNSCASQWDIASTSGRGMLSEGDDPSDSGEFVYTCHACNPYIYIYICIQNTLNVF